MNGNLKNKVLSGIFWKFGERILSQGVSFIVSIILARLLLPEDYGIVAIVLVFINLANVFISNGLGDALIQKSNSNDKDFSTVFYCNLLLAILLYIILFFTAPLIAQFYKNNDLILVLRVLALQLPLSSINSIQQAYVSKHMMFKKFFLSTLIGTSLSGCLGVFLAYNGAGIWALVFQYMSNVLINTLILFITVKWYPKLIFDVDSAKILFSSGSKLVSAQFINQAYIESKNLFIGKIYSSADLAYYNKGDQFPSMIVMNINSAISSVLFPAMTIANQENGKLKEMTRMSIKMCSYVVLPIVVGLIIVAEPMVRLLLTEKWLLCVPFLQISCLFWAFQPSQTANVQAIKATGRNDILLKLEVFKKIVGVLILVITIFISPLAVAIGNVIFGCLSAIINIIPNKKLINYGLWEQIKDIFPSILISLIMLIVVYPLQLFGLNDVLTLFLQIFSGILCYVLLSYIFKVDCLINIINLLKKQFKK